MSTINGKTLEEIEKSIDRCRMVNEREGIEFLSPRISADTLAALVSRVRELEEELKTAHADGADAMVESWKHDDPRKRATELEVRVGEVERHLEMIRKLVSGERKTELPLAQAIANTFMAFKENTPTKGGSSDFRFEFEGEIWSDLKVLIGDSELFENVKKVVQAKLDRMKADAAGHARKFTKEDKKAAEDALGRGRKA